MVLYFIGLFNTTLYVTVNLKIRTDALLYTVDNFYKGIFKWQVYTSLFTTLITILIISILYQVSKLEPNEDLTNLSNKKFIGQISVHAVSYIVGYLTFISATLMVNNIYGQKSASMFNSGIIDLFGLVDLGNRSSGFLYGTPQYTFFISFFTAISSAILPLLMLITSNLIHLRSQSNDGEILYPTK